VVSVLKQRGEQPGPSVWNARTMFDVAVIVSDAVRDIKGRDGKYLAGSGTAFNASFIIGGQIRGESHRLFRTFAEGNFIEAGADTPFFQTGEAKYGKPIIDPVITPSTTLGDAMKCVLVSFDSTMRSNLSVGMPIDLLCIERDTFRTSVRHRFGEADAYFTALSKDWQEGIRAVFKRLPEVPLLQSTTSLPLPLAAPADGSPPL
jgi:putative proteasome-type protease